MKIKPIQILLSIIATILMILSAASWFLLLFEFTLLQTLGSAFGFFFLFIVVLFILIGYKEMNEN